MKYRVEQLRFHFCNNFEPETPHPPVPWLPSSSLSWLDCWSWYFLSCIPFTLTSTPDQFSRTQAGTNWVSINCKESHSKSPEIHSHGEAELHKTPHHCQCTCKQRLHPKWMKWGSPVKWGLVLLASATKKTGGTLCFVLSKIHDNMLSCFPQLSFWTQNDYRV